MQKIIFLDFDGVITTMASRYALDRYKCDLLQQVIDLTGAKIVVSSSWREGSVEETIAELRNVPTCFKKFVPSWVDEIVGVTIRAYNYIRKGVHLGIPRGVEIKQWIDTHLHRDEEGKYERKQVGVDFQYVILDDDSDMLLEHADHFIHTDGYLGMSQADAIRAVCILNGCSPEEVEGVVDESPFQTFKAAEEEARRSIEEEIRERKEKETSNESKRTD